MIWETIAYAALGGAIGGGITTLVIIGIRCILEGWE
jgi:hypothetical protein